MTAIPETRYAPTGGGRIAYQVVGDGPLDLIVAKHFQMPADLMWYEPRFVKFLDRLSSFSRHIWFDIRGSGSSDPIPFVQGRVAESVVDDMVSVLDHLGCEQAGVLALAPDAVLFAATHPERTKALVLSDPSARYRWAEDYPCGWPDNVVDELLSEIRDNWGAVPFHARFAPSLSNDTRFQEWLARCERLACSPDEGYQRISAAFNLDVRDVLSSVRVPTLVVATPRGRRSLGQARYVADHITGSKRVEVPGDRLFLANEALGDAIEEFLTGKLPAHEIDRVLATVLFTDMVGSTEEAARLGDRRWKQVLSSHDDLVGQEIERHRGRQIKSMGDSVLATFDGPARAVRCACAIRDAVRSTGMEVRAGLHTGEIELRGEDVGGIGVHIAARVSALAGAGEVLVSRTVVDLVVGSGIKFEDRGEHELKGVPGTWKLFAVGG